MPIGGAVTRPPMSSTKATLRLAESLDGDGNITRAGADRLVETVHEFESIARTSGGAVS